MAGHLNALLIVFAIGLATLDLTFLVSEQVVDYLPQMARTFAVAQPTASPDWNTNQLGPP